MRAQFSISPRVRGWKLLAAVISAGAIAVAFISPNAMATATTSKAPSAAVDLFADRVQTLGIEHYPGTFAGATLEPTGVTVVYAVAGPDAKLVRAVRALDTHGYPVKVVAVKRSYSQLMAISAKVLRSYSRLRAKGINPAQFGPDPASGTVAVTLLKPTAAGMSALALAQGARVTSSNYRAQASAALKQQAGAGITLRSQYATSSWAAQGRMDDRAPYFDGDQIYRVAAGITCTSGFNLVGPGGGEYMVTAGHCGSGTWKTHASTIGNTSVNYLTATSGNDFQLTYLAGGGLGAVWTNGTNVAPVTGALFPAVGAPITFNGSITGEVRGNTVQGTNQAICLNGVPQTGGAPYCVGNQTIAQNAPGVIFCQEGDSGGPVYSHTPDVNVLAVGIITGGKLNSDGSEDCAATQIDHVVFITGKSLLTS